MTLSRRYPTDAPDLWEAITDPARIARWFTPIHGDLRIAGKYQLEGNAGGEILECEAPRHFRVTFGDASSIVRVTLTPHGEEETELTLQHSVPAAFAGSVADALFVGPGWDGALVALGLFIDGVVADDSVAAASSPEAREMSKQSIELWTAMVVDASGTPEEVEGGRQAALTQFVGAE